MDEIERRANELMKLTGASFDTAMKIALFEAGEMSNDVYIVDSDGVERPAPLGSVLGEDDQ